MTCLALAGKCVRQGGRSRSDRLSAAVCFAEQRGEGRAADGIDAAPGRSGGGDSDGIRGFDTGFMSCDPSWFSRNADGVRGLSPLICRMRSVSAHAVGVPAKRIADSSNLQQRTAALPQRIRLIHDLDCCPITADATSRRPASTGDVIVLCMPQNLKPRLCSTSRSTSQNSGNLAFLVKL